jgi:hypothetical protein
LPQVKQHDYKYRQTFQETPPFDSPLPFIAMFFLRPPFSNLVMSPKINHRQVACDTFATVPSGKSSSLRDILYSNEEYAKTAFRSRQFLLYPFKIAKKTQSGIQIQSLSSWKVKRENETLENTTVVLENACASNISNEDFKRLMALFGRPVDGRSNIYNFVDLLDIKSPMTDTSQVVALVKELGFPAGLVNRDQRVEVNLRRLASFISMSSPICFGAPEGQTRMEAASRPCFGFRLYGSAPLRDKKGPLTTDFNEDIFFRANQSLPPGSTAFTNVQGSVLFTSAEKILDSYEAQQLQKISEIVQQQSNLEVNTTFQHFYRDVIQQVVQNFTNDSQPLTEKEWANYNVKSIPKKDRKEKHLRPEERKKTNLNQEINRILVHRVFSTPPFNDKLPQNPTDKTKVLTEDKFLELSVMSKNWFTQKPFYTCFLPKMAIHSPKGPSVGYFLPKKLNSELCIDPSLSPLFKQCAWSTPNMVFEMLFSVLSYEPLLQCFNEFLQTFKATSRFYDPLWLSAYVFYPVSCMSHFYKDYYFSTILQNEISSNMQGKIAPVKAKLLCTFRIIFLQEYFKVITEHANRKKFTTLPAFEHFQHAQRSEWDSWTGSTPRKFVWIASEFLEMVLFTLPEKLNERILSSEDDTFYPFENCDFHWMSGRFHKRSVDGTPRNVTTINECEPLNKMPSISDLLPKNIIPSNIMANENVAMGYTTITLENLIEPNDGKRRRSASATSTRKKKNGRKTTTSLLKLATTKTEKLSRRKMKTAKVLLARETIEAKKMQK